MRDDISEMSQISSSGHHTTNWKYVIMQTSAELGKQRRPTCIGPIGEVVSFARFTVTSGASKTKIKFEDLSSHVFMIF